MPKGIYPRIAAVERFYSKIEILGECWLWTAGLDEDGHAQFWLEGRNVPGHRYAYIISGKPLARGKVLHHTCLHKHCVNPDHVIATTAPNHASIHGQAKMRCKRNHPLTGENVWISNGKRHCRSCRREAVRRHRIGEKAATD